MKKESQNSIIQLFGSFGSEYNYSMFEYKQAKKKQISLTKLENNEVYNEIVLFRGNNAAGWARANFTITVTAR